MADPRETSKLVEHAVEEALESRIPSLQQAITKDVMEVIQPLLEAADSTRSGLQRELESVLHSVFSSRLDQENRVADGLRINVSMGLTPQIQKCGNLVSTSGE